MKNSKNLPLANNYLYDIQYKRKIPIQHFALGRTGLYALAFCLFGFIVDPKHFAFFGLAAVLYVFIRYKRSRISYNKKFLIESDTEELIVYVYINKILRTALKSKYLGVFVFLAMTINVSSVHASSLGGSIRDSIETSDEYNNDSKVEAQNTMKYIEAKIGATHYKEHIIDITSKTNKLKHLNADVKTLTSKNILLNTEINYAKN